MKPTKCDKKFDIILFLMYLMIFLSSCSTESVGIEYKPDPALQAFAPDNGTMEILLKEERSSFDFFWETANRDEDSPGYGLIPDRMPSYPGISSIASVGFGLTGIPIAVERGWVTREEGEKRVKGTLLTLLNNVEHEHGFFYHFIDMKSGKRVWECEVSVIDTALCINGVIMTGEYFGGEIQELAEKIYLRVDWPWYTDKGGAGKFYMGYTPEDGFFGAWNMTAEQLMMYFLGAGSPEKPIDPGMLYVFQRPKGSYGGLPEMIHSPAGSLFVYQFSHAWFDLRNTKDLLGVDWFRNSTIAALSSRQYAINNAERYGTSELDWGFSASDGPNGYSGGFGSQPAIGNFNDGTVPAYGSAGSIVFTPENSAKSIVHMYEQYPELWGNWGFKDAYNKTKTPMWIAKDVIGIDKGITMLMIENYLTGMVWEYMMKNKYVQSGMKRCGIQPLNSYAVESFEDNTELKVITVSSCTFTNQQEEVYTGLHALRVDTEQGGRLRFRVNPKLLSGANNTLLQFAVKYSDKGKITIRYYDKGGTELKSVETSIKEQDWTLAQIPAAQAMGSDIQRLTFVEFEFHEGGVVYLDDIEFVNDSPRIYNVILDGSRKVGSVLKPLWNTWDKENRNIYIDEIRWYTSDSNSPDSEWKLIDGEQKLTYIIKEEDAGKFIKCELLGVIPEEGELIWLSPAQSNAVHAAQGGDGPALSH